MIWHYGKNKVRDIPGGSFREALPGDLLGTLPGILSRTGDPHRDSPWNYGPKACSHGTLPGILSRTRDPHRESPWSYPPRDPPQDPRFSPRASSEPYPRVVPRDPSAGILPRDLHRYPTRLPLDYQYLSRCIPRDTGEHKQARAFCLSVCANVQEII